MGAVLIALLLPFAGAILLNLFSAPRSARAGWVASLFAGASFLAVASAALGGIEQPPTLYLPWAPALDLSLSLLADGLSLLFALVISAVGVVVFTFAAAYLEPHEQRRRFFCYLLLFMGAMLGVVFSSNLLALFVFWELTSISSFLLIGFWHHKERSRYGALKALVITATGGLAMLLGFIMIGLVCGTFEIPELLGRGDLLAASPWALPAVLLVIAGAITKSAQFPFHLWLPTAMEAPTPVSAYLHAATMVKAGLYLVARLGPIMSPLPLWTPLLTVIGIATMVWCSYLALRQSDLKGLLAFSTVSQLGLIMSMLAAARPEAAAAGLFHLLNHAAFKGALFLLVGVIEHEAHTRDVCELGPLRKQMPKTHLLLALGALSMAGMPPLGGFISKEMFLEQALHLGPLLAMLSVAGAVLTAAYCFALAFGVGRGRKTEGASATATSGAEAPHDPHFSLLWGPGLLITVALLFGLFPQSLAGALVAGAVEAAVPGSSLHLHLSLWHGFSPTLAASAVALGSGYILYSRWWQTRTPDNPLLVTDRIYDFKLEKLESWSKAVTVSYMSGLVWRYNTIILCVGVAAISAVFLCFPVPQLQAWPARSPLVFEVAVALTAIAAVIGTCIAKTRLAAILSLGASGYTLALMFALLGAPDLALTQIMVETISVALFLAVFVFLPSWRPPETRPLRPGHLALSITAGCGACYLVALARGHRTATSIAEFFIENSAKLAGWHNIVNVILVDFRGLDTLGEISVLGIAALACYAAIKMAPQRS